MWGGGDPSQQARGHHPLLYPSPQHPPPPSLAHTLSDSLLGQTSSPTLPPTPPGSPLLQAPLYTTPPPPGLRPSLILSLHTHSVFLSLQQVSQAAVTPGPAWQLGGGAAALGLWLWRAVAALAAERGLSSWGAQVSCLVACGIFPHQGSPSPPALAGGFSIATTGGVPSRASFVFALYLLFFYFLILSSKVTLFPHRILNEKEHNFSITKGKQSMADMAGVLSICSYLLTLHRSPNFSLRRSRLYFPI